MRLSSTPCACASPCGTRRGNGSHHTSSAPQTFQTRQGRVSASRTGVPRSFPRILRRHRHPDDPSFPAAMHVRTLGHQFSFALEHSATAPESEGFGAFYLYHRLRGSFVKGLEPATEGGKDMIGDLASPQLIISSAEPMLNDVTVRHREQKFSRSQTRVTAHGKTFVAKIEW